jgi:DNA/RNA endonuclease YhcR with UshA esterase domain
MSLALSPESFFPDIYDICKDVLVEGAILYINGKVDEYKGKKQVLASEVCLIRDEIESLDLEETYEQQ